MPAVEAVVGVKGLGELRLARVDLLDEEEREEALEDELGRPLDFLRAVFLRAPFLGAERPIPSRLAPALRPRIAGLDDLLAPGRLEDSEGPLPRREAFGLGGAATSRFPAGTDFVAAASGVSPARSLRTCSNKACRSSERSARASPTAKRPRRSGPIRTRTSRLTGNPSTRRLRRICLFLPSTSVSDSDEVPDSGS